MQLNPDQLSAVTKIIQTHFENSDDGKLYLELLNLFATNGDAVYERFSKGMEVEVLNAITTSKNLEDLKNKFFKFSNVYVDVIPLINSSGGLPQMMASNEEKKIKMGLSVIQLAAKITCLKAVLINYFQDKLVYRLDDEIKNTLKNN
jgi:hypothetical protein